MLLLVKQSHYAELDKKWLSKKRYNHPEQEMFNVAYAVVDRVAMASGAPPLVKVQPWGSARSQGCKNHSIYAYFCHSIGVFAHWLALSPNLSTLSDGIACLLFLVPGMTPL